MIALRAYLDHHEAACIAHTLISVEGNTDEAARLLGLPAVTLRFRMKRCGLVSGDQRGLRSTERRRQLRSLEAAAKHYAPPQ